MTSPITIKTVVKKPVADVWQYWNQPEHITQWNHASDDWHAPHAEIDLRKDGRFKVRMAAKDGSVAFDFQGTYSNVQEHKLIEFILDDGRKVTTTFSDLDGNTEVTETFDPENIHPVEFQRMGWQAILDNFKKYTEAK